MQTLGITNMDCEKCGWYSRTARRCKRGGDFEDACCAIDDAPEANPEPKWIPCSERLPEEGKDVLVTVYFMGLEQKYSTGWNDHIKPSYYVDLASHIDGEWHCASDEYKIALKRNKVIAWMPLPEPYKEGEPNENR